METRVSLRYFVSYCSRHTSHSRTFIDNIFSNVISKDIICGNITVTTPDIFPTNSDIFFTIWLSTKTLDYPCFD